MDIMRLVVVLLVVALVGSVHAENAKKLKGIKAKKITWKKDRAKMVLIPWISSYSKFGDPNFEPFFMDTACVDVCPVEVIYAEDDIPEEWKWESFTEKNAEFFAV